MNQSPHGMELRVSVDVGCHTHSVVVGLLSGELLDAFVIPHDPKGFQEFFSRIEQHRRQHDGSVSVAMEAKAEELARCSPMTTILSSLPGFGPVCTAELAGEIGSIGRFAGESSLALYLGMALLTHSSGTHKGTRLPTHVNTRAKAAMMVAVDRHRKQVLESQEYYEKKRYEGKKHNQAIRALGRHLSRAICKMLKEKRGYMTRI